jgi:hypothetical protein
VVREREGGARAGGAYLNMMMPPMKVAQRVAPEQMTKEMSWGSLAEMRWDTHSEEADRHLGGGDESRAPLTVVVEEGPPYARGCSTVTHPSTTPSRDLSTSCNALASENRIPVDLWERDKERSRESERG